MKTNAGLTTTLKLPSAVSTISILILALCPCRQKAYKYAFIAYLVNGIFFENCHITYAETSAAYNKNMQISLSCFIKLLAGELISFVCNTFTARQQLHTQKKIYYLQCQFVVCFIHLLMAKPLLVKWWTIKWSWIWKVSILTIT